MDSLCESVPLCYIAWRLNYVLQQGGSAESMPFVAGYEQSFASFC